MLPNKKKYARGENHQAWSSMKFTSYEQSLPCLVQYDFSLVNVDVTKVSLGQNQVCQL
jgi:hypothetical protein